INSRTLLAFGQKSTLTIDSQGGDDVIQLGGRDLFDGLTQTTLVGGAGDDTLFGSAGADTFLPGSGQNIVDGQTGDDIVLFEGTDGDDVVMIQPGEVMINDERTTLVGVVSIGMFL